MSSYRRFPTLAAALALVALGAACDNVGPGEAALSDSQADSLAEVMTTDMDAEIDAATSSGASAGMELNVGVCLPTISPTPVVNTDGDRTPDSVRIAFAACANTWPFHTDSISGSIDLIDPSPAVAGLSAKFVFTSLAHKRVFPGGLFTSITLNGVRQASRDSSVLQHTVTGFTTAYVFRNGGTASHTRTWSSIFTADVAGSIARDAALPSGDWSVAGTSSWTRGSRTHQVTVSTNPDLHFNSTCTVVPRFDSGTAVAVVTRDGATSTVTVQFTACGQYTVTRS